jgi:maltose alpha-D-glucosyltransferase/alpha-amylase
MVLAPGWQQAMDRTDRAPEIREVFAHATHERLRDDVLLPYLQARRWFAAKNEKIGDIRMSMIAPWKTPAATWSVSFVDTFLANGKCQRYFLPLALDWETRSFDPSERYGTHGVARVRHKDRVGLYYAAFANPEFPRDMARAMGASAEVPLVKGRLRFSSTALFAQYADAIADEVRVPALEQSNTAVFFGNRLFLKGFRRVREGVNPELEMGRFLTEVSPYPNIAPVLGAAEYVEEGVEPVTLAVLQRYIENQGDLWTLICQHLTRMLSMPTATAPGDTTSHAESVAAGFHLGRMALLGRRIAELHRALAKPTGDPAFDPEPVTQPDLDGWKAGVEREIEETFDVLDAAMPSLPEEARTQLRELAAVREKLHAKVRATHAQLDGLTRTRFHGDLHLGQILVAQDDFIVVDFEGEPARSLDERRAKASVLRDVAGMLRSFSYAAHSAALRRDAGTPNVDLATAKLGEWERDARHHFLEGYMKSAAGVSSVPADGASLGSLLDLFLIEKALYELRYEAANRPDWIAIPLRGLLELTT